MKDKTLNSIKRTCSGIFIKGSFVVLQLNVSDMHYKYVEINLNNTFPHIILSKIRKGRLVIDEPYFGFHRYVKEGAIQYISKYAKNEYANSQCVEETLKIVKQTNL